MNCGNENDENKMWFQHPQENTFTINKLRIGKLTKFDFRTYYCVNITADSNDLTGIKMILLPEEPKDREKSIDEEVQYIENVKPKGREIRYVPGEVKNISDIVIWEHPPGTILLDQGREFYIDSYNVNHTNTFFYYRINRKGDYLINKVGKIFISEWKEKEIELFVEGIVSYGAKLNVTCLSSSDVQNDTKVIWRRNDKRIHQGNTYIIKKYQEESFGNYTCEIQKKEVTIKSKNINLTPENYLELKIEMKPEPEKYYNFQMGSIRHLYCKTIKENFKRFIPKDIIWTFNGNNVNISEASKRYKRRDTKSASILTLLNLDPSSEGTYKCFQGFTTFAVNLLMERKSIFLKVYPDVKILEVNDKDFVEFICEINTPGFSSNLIHWTFTPNTSYTEEELPKDAKIRHLSLLTSLLTIDNVLERHAGVYSCKVFSKKVTATLIVIKTKLSLSCQFINKKENIYLKNDNIKIKKVNGSPLSKLTQLFPLKNATTLECDIYNEIQKERKTNNVFRKEMKKEFKKEKTKIEKYRIGFEEFRNKTKEKVLENQAKDKEQNTEIILLKFNNILKKRCEHLITYQTHVESYITCSNIHFDFIWYIEDVSKKSLKVLYSPPFYTNSYKLRLYFFYRDLENFYSFGFLIMKGDFDNLVEWPLKMKVTVSFLFKISLFSFLNKTFTYDTYSKKEYFERPKNEQENLIKVEFEKVPIFPFDFNDTFLLSCMLSKH